MYIRISMYICMYVCMCIYVCIYIYIYLNLYIYTYKYIYVFITIILAQKLFRTFHSCAHKNLIDFHLKKQNLRNRSKFD